MDRRSGYSAIHASIDRTEAPPAVRGKYFPEPRSRPDMADISASVTAVGPGVRGLVLLRTAATVARPTLAGRLSGMTVSGGTVDVGDRERGLLGAPRAAWGAVPRVPRDSQSSAAEPAHHVGR